MILCSAPFPPERDSFIGLMAHVTYFQLLLVSRKSVRAVLHYLRRPNSFAGIAKQLPFYKYLDQIDLSDFSSIALGLDASSFLQPDHWRDSKYQIKMKVFIYYYQRIGENLEVNLWRLFLWELQYEIQKRHFMICGHCNEQVQWDRSSAFTSIFRKNLLSSWFTFGLWTSLNRLEI